MFKEATSRSDKIESTSNNVQVRKKQQHRRRYRHWRNKVCSLIKLSKCNYYRQMITDCYGNIGRVWKVLRELSDKQEQNWNRIEK